MSIKDLQKNWNEFGKTDPLWAILTAPDKKYNKWDTDDFFKNGEEEIDALMRYLHSIYNNFSRKKALDFGCGVGRLTQALANRFDEVYGIDIAQSMIKLANGYNKYGEKCHYILNESNDLKLFDDNSFDLIYSNIVLQHMKPDYSKNYIKEFIRVLAPKGVIVFQIPSGVYTVAGQSICHALPDSAFKARIDIKKPPSKMEVCSQMGLYANVKNISNVTWSAIGDTGGKYFIKLGNHWLDDEENVVINDDARSVLPKDIEPMDEVELYLTITAPQTPGTYILEFDMVQEAVTWFKDKGSETAKIKVIIYQTTDKIQSSPKIILKIKKLMEKLYPRRIYPKMEMYGVKKDEILDLISENGGILIDVKEDGCAGKEWISFRYCVTKE